MMSTTDIDFGHSDEGMSPIAASLLTNGMVVVNNTTYTIKSVDLVEQFTDPMLKPHFNVCIEIVGSAVIENGNYLATGTLRQCCEYILSL